MLISECGMSAHVPGFVALLTALAVLSAGCRSSVAAVEMRTSEGVQDSSVPGLRSSTAPAAVSSPADGDRGAERSSCPARCRCEVDGLLHRVDCSDRGLREVPGNLSVFTSYL